MERAVDRTSRAHERAAEGAHRTAEMVQGGAHPAAKGSGPPHEGAAAAQAPGTVVDRGRETCLHPGGATWGAQAALVLHSSGTSRGASIGMLGSER